MLNWPSIRNETMKVGYLVFYLTKITYSSILEIIPIAAEMKALEDLSKPAVRA